MTPGLKQQDELKRERQWNPRARRRVLQDTLAWAEAQGAVRRNTPAERIKEQARKLASLDCSRDRPVPPERFGGGG